MEGDFFKQLKDYCDLGYDISMTHICGKDAIRMIKRYSYKAEKPLYCEQIVNHEKLENEEYLQNVLDFMYNHIQQQEEKCNYYEPHYF